MNYAIELFFDPATEKHIASMILAMHQKKIGSDMFKTGSRPHITLFVFKSKRISSLRSELKAFARTTPAFSIRFTRVGTFRGVGAVFLRPHQKKLMKIQKKCAKFTARYFDSIREHYRPKNIVFHSTIGIGLNLDKIKKGMLLGTQMGLPKNSRITHVGLVAVPEKPVPKVKEIFSVPLSH